MDKITDTTIVDKMSVLLGEKEDITSLLQNIDIKDNTMLHLVIKNPESLEIICKLIAKYHSQKEKEIVKLLKKRNHNGYTALHLATQYLNLKSLIIICKLIAECCSQEEIVELLKIKDNNGNTALHWATNYPESLEIICKLIAECCSQEEIVELFKIKSNNGNTALHLATNHSESLIIIYRFIEKYFPKEGIIKLFQERNHDGNIALHWATQHPKPLIIICKFIAECCSQEEIVELLKIKDNNGNIALHWATNYPESLEIICKLIAECCSQEEIVELFKIKSNNGNTALHLATNHSESLIIIYRFIEKYFPKEEIIKLLQERNKNGNIALQLATNYSESLSIISHFILYNCSRDKVLREQSVGLLLEKDNNGNTALHLAIKNPESLSITLNLIYQLCPDNIKELLNQKNNKEETVLHLAKQHPESLKIIRKLILKQYLEEDYPEPATLSIPSQSTEETIPESPALSGKTTLSTIDDYIDFLLTYDPVVYEEKLHEAVTAQSFPYDDLAKIAHDNVLETEKWETFASCLGKYHEKFGGLIYCLMFALRTEDEKILEVVVNNSEITNDDFLTTIAQENEWLSESTLLHWVTQYPESLKIIFNFITKHSSEKEIIDLLNVKDNNGNTALHLARKNTESLKIIRKFISDQYLEEDHPKLTTLSIPPKQSTEEDVPASPTLFGNGLLSANDYVNLLLENPKESYKELWDAVTVQSFPYDDLAKIVHDNVLETEKWETFASCLGKYHEKFGGLIYCLMFALRTEDEKILEVVVNNSEITNDDFLTTIAQENEWLSESTLLHWVTQYPESLKIIFNFILKLYPDKKELKENILWLLQQEDNDGLTMFHSAIQYPESLETIFKFITEYCSKEEIVELLKVKDINGNTTLRLPINYPKSLEIIHKFIPEQYFKEVYPEPPTLSGNIPLNTINDYVDFLYNYNTEDYEKQLQGVITAGTFPVHNLATAFRDNLLTTQQLQAFAYCLGKYHEKFGGLINCIIFALLTENKEALETVLTASETTKDDFLARITEINASLKGMTLLHTMATIRQPEGLKLLCDYILELWSEDDRLKEKVRNLLQQKTHLGTVLHHATACFKCFEIICDLICKTCPDKLQGLLDETNHQNETVPVYVKNKSKSSEHLPFLEIINKYISKCTEKVSLQPPIDNIKNQP